MRRAGIAVLLLVLPAAGCRARADLVVLNGVVWTGASSGAPRPGAIAVRGDRILLVGDSAEIASYVGGATTVLDARGGLVMPGFGDGHTHFVSGGFQLGAVDLRDAATPAEFVQRLGAYARGLAPGVWITGGDWDHESWAGAPLPRREWIDSVTPDNPVFVNRLDGHMALANSAALRLARIGRGTRDIPGGVIVRDRNGQPTGILKDEAMGPVYAAIPSASDAQRDAALRRAMQHAASKGVTTVN